MKNHNSHWTHYWNSGVLTSLPQDFKNNYDGEIFDFWYKQVSNFKNKSTVVDVCTGNGAIALMIKKIALELNKEINVVAIDAAIINIKSLKLLHPKLTNLIDMITFIHGVKIENIDKVITKKIDYVVSQYGIEYCKIKTVSKKFNKILKKNGKLIFISHAANTDIYNHMKKEQECYLKLKQFGVFNLFKSFFNNRVKPSTFISKLNSCLDLIELEYGNSVNKFIYEWTQTMEMLAKMPKQTLLSNKQNIKKFYYLHFDARKRSDDLLAVSKKISNNPKWHKKFIKNGFTLNSHNDILYKKHHKIGHYYEFSRKKNKLNVRSMKP